MTADSDDHPLPALPGPQGALGPLAERARDYARAASSANTRRAYESDWRHFLSWCRRRGLEAFPADPQNVGLYIADCASARPPMAVSTIERHLAAIGWHHRQRNALFDRRDPHVATVMAGIRRSQGRPPRQKEAVLAEEIVAMLGTLDAGTLRGLRDRAILLIGFAGGLRRSEIVGLDLGPQQSTDASGHVEILDGGLLVTLRGKTGWREVEIGPGSSSLTCPVAALRTWLDFARIGHGPLFRRVTAKGRKVGPERLEASHVARLVKRTALAAGLRAGLTEAERRLLFSGHSLRAGLATSAEAEERHVQKQLGHASAEMTRRYQRRRERFRVNLTRAAGL